MNEWFKTYGYKGTESKNNNQHWVSAFNLDFTNRGEQLDQIIAKKQKGEAFTREDLTYMVTECRRTYDPSFTPQEVYLKMHSNRVYYKTLLVEAERLLTSLFPEFYLFLNKVKQYEGDVWGSKKDKKHIVETATRLVKKVEADMEQLADYPYGFVSNDWEYLQTKTIELNKKCRKRKTLKQEELDFLFKQSIISFEEQVETGHLFFTHPLNLKKNDRAVERQLIDYKETIFKYYQVIEKWAKEEVRFFFHQSFLDQAKEDSFNTLNSDSSFIIRYIRTNGYKWSV